MLVRTLIVTIPFLVMLVMGLIWQWLFSAVETGLLKSALYGSWGIVTAILLYWILKKLFVRAKLAWPKLDAKMFFLGCMIGFVLSTSCGLAIASLYGMEIDPKLLS